MLVDGVPYRTIWRDRDVVRAIDQRGLPFSFDVVTIRTVDEMIAAISDMTVRGAGLIGAAAGYGMALAATDAARRTRDPVERYALVVDAGDRLLASRPTAVNLAWAVRRQLDALATIDDAAAFVERADREADAIADGDAAACRAIGGHGLPLLADVHDRTGAPVQVLTHCNAGWLAFVDHGSALAPVYAAHDAGIPVHVWVDETRPRNQGARLTAWELAGHGVPHTLIADNAGGHLMQEGLVDLVLVGSDRTTASGDVANKVGTYLKALAAADNGVPFHVALPSSSIDWDLDLGVGTIPIEARDPAELTVVEGIDEEGALRAVQLAPEGTEVANPAFDVTPARLVTGLITERGRCAASAEGIAALFGRTPR